jgi:hypothetical protein
VFARIIVTEFGSPREAMDNLPMGGLELFGSNANFAFESRGVIGEMVLVSFGGQRILQPERQFAGIDRLV